MTKIINLSIEGEEDLKLSLSETRRGKKTTLVFDLILSSYDVKEENGDKLMNEYREYLKTFPFGKHATVVYGGFKTVLLLRVLTSDADYWKDRVITFLKDIKNLEKLPKIN
jgi:hypothetical protein